MSTSNSDRFKQALTAVLLQALSFGQVNESVNGRASLLLASRPGASKKMMALLGLMLAACGQMIQPTMVSPAGLSARVEPLAGGWKAVPGALPSCSGGTLVLEDMHRLSSTHLNAIQGALMAAAEDGRVIPNKAARANYTAYVALQINTNLQSVIRARLRAPGAKGKLEDLGIPFDLLSRLDMIIDLTLGDNAVKQARDIAIQIIPRRSSESQAQKKQKRRELQILVARMIDRFEVVDLLPVSESMGLLMDDISLTIADFSARMSEEQQQMFDGEGLLRRMANSVRKLVSAAARLDGRAEANEKDVALCWDLLSFKLEIVRWICNDQATRVRTLSSREEMVGRAERAALSRWNEIMGAFAGREITVVEIAETLGYNVRTVGRDLEAHGVYPQSGWCQVPDLIQEAERAQAARAGQAPPGPEQGASTEDDYLTPEGVEDDEEQGERPSGLDHLLPLLPLHYQPVVAALAAEEDVRERDMLAAHLVEVAVEYDPHPFETPAKIGVLERELREKVGVLDQPILKSTMAELVADNEEERSLLALQLLSESMLPVPAFRLQAALEKEGMHAVVRNAAEAVLLIDRWREAEPVERREISEEIFDLDWVEEGEIVTADYEEDGVVGEESG